jgi:hypothetical protein
VEKFDLLRAVRKQNHAEAPREPRPADNIYRWCSGSQVQFFSTAAILLNLIGHPAYREWEVGMKGLSVGLASFCFVSLFSGLVHAQGCDGTAKQEFISGGKIRIHMEAGGYRVAPGDSDNIVVSCRANSDYELKEVKVEIQRSGSTAEVHISNTPSNNFRAEIEVPRRSNLWIRLSAGEMVVEDVEGDKNVQALAGRIQIDVPHPEQYGHRDASVTTGSIEAGVFDVSKGGLFRSFEQDGPGKYRLHAHLMTGEIEFHGKD